ncbi:MAG TPA: hypothetical protein VNW25_07460 [Candidatus Sulfotelmatobacter sp.]|nr:hypothetical protein [Candidatus Sulfotelmatobacter sp.]
MSGAQLRVLHNLAIGALGGVAGPLAGSAVDALRGTAGGVTSTLLEGTRTGTGQAGIDAAGVIVLSRSAPTLQRQSSLPGWEINSPDKGNGHP